MDERGKYARMFAATDIDALSDGDLVNRSDLTIMMKIEPRDAVIDDQALGVFENIVQTYAKGRASRIDVFDAQKPTYLAPMDFDARKAFIEKYSALCDIRVYRDRPGSADADVQYGVALH